MEKKTFDWRSLCSTKERLVLFGGFLLIILYLPNSFFEDFWVDRGFRFQVYSMMITVVYIMIFLMGLYHIRTMPLFKEKELKGALLILAGSLPILIPPSMELWGLGTPGTYSDYPIPMTIGAILVIIGVILLARNGGFFSIWMAGATVFFFLGIHEAGKIVLWTGNYGPYDTVFFKTGIWYFTTAFMLFIYGELKFKFLLPMIRRAAKLRVDGKPDRALALVNIALFIYPHYATAWNNKGNILLNKDMHQEAEECYQRALYLNPDLHPALENLSRCKMGQRRSGYGKGMQQTSPAR